MGHPVRTGAHSSIITSGKLAITMEQDQDQEILIARSFDDGVEVWRLAEKTKWHDMLSGTGPRSTPTLHNGKIYALFSNGQLSCVDASTFKMWKSKMEEFKSSQMITISQNRGLSISPLIWNDMIVLSLGGESAAVVAYSIDSGETSRKKAIRSLRKRRIFISGSSSPPE